jgi:hypothetical protein
MNHRFDNFNHLVDAALNTECKRWEIEDKKRKMVPTASGNPASVPVPAVAAAEADPVVPATTAAVPASSSAAATGETGPEASNASGTLYSTGSTSSTAGNAYSSYRTAGSSAPTGVLSLWQAGTLRQRLSPEGAVRTAGAPSSAQGAIPGQGEPRDGRVSGRGSQRGYWYIHGQYSPCYGAFRYWCYAFLHYLVFC